MTTVASTSYADANHKVEANKPQGCGRTPPRPVQSKLQSYPPAVGEPTASGTLLAASRKRDKGPALGGAGPSSAVGAAQSRPCFLRMSAASDLSITMVGRVMTGGIFSPLSNLTASRSPSAPGVA